MRRTKAEAAETRAAILDAAEKMFFEKGVGSTTLDEIAASAGVTRGAVYWHFHSKTDIFLELYNTFRLPLLNMLELRDPACCGMDALTMIEDSACEWMQVMATDQQRQRMLTILLRTNFTEEFAPVQQAMKELEELHNTQLEQILQRAQANGKLATGWTPASACYAVKWMIKGICWDWLLGGRNFDLDSEGCGCVRRLFASFRNPASPCASATA
ncbi:TetR family transcriptional regulator [Neorhizobium sp. JUb45]|uniref:TetR family transcriptional regulator n=1 Tax=unclassified Neorhizobium TaxID=2629175 RepID=UPI0010437ABA|nr:TetR family transcriptional regulator [Neorhizobium sp. JUb45]TCR05026.1 TetR family transcriptional regulator [Neorhizobium sp. JUb45]